MSITQSAIDQALVAAGGDSTTTAEAHAVSSAPASELAPDAELRHILGLTVPVTVTLAERDMSVEDILKFSLGTIIEFNVSFDAELTLSVANHPVAYGHAVKIGEQFGLRLTTIGTVRDRIDALGG